MFAARLIKILQASDRWLAIPYSDDPEIRRNNLRAAAQALAVAAVFPEDLCLNVITYAVGRLSDEAKASGRMIGIYTTSTAKNQLKEVFFFGSTRPIAETMGNDRLFQSSLFVLATMSRVPGRSGSFDGFYFHPPVLNKVLVTSNRVRTQALSAEVEARVKPRQAERDVRDAERELERLRGG
jgi:hypothetical protein